MKHNFKKLIALLLTVVMILCMLPVTAIAADSEQEPEDLDSTPRVDGYIPVRHPMGRTVTNAYLSGDRATYNRFTGATRDVLPSQYDSRTKNIVTSVKNQSPYGSCWAHAAMATLESYMIYHSIPVGNGAAPTLDLDLSETQHCWFNYTYAYDAEGMLTGDKSIPQENCMEQGGNGEMSAYTLMRWTGAATEDENDLKYQNSSKVNYSGLNSKYAYNYNICHVQNSEWIPAVDVEAVKEAIMAYGAGNISYYAGPGGAEGVYTNEYQCTIDNTEMTDPDHLWANHAITVIGWDDTIPASEFSPDVPSSDGAWLCKNSWGTDNFGDGFMYISYEDTSVLDGEIFFMDAEPIDNYQHNYQYDGSCNVCCYGKGWSDPLDDYEPLENDSQVANVFTAKGNELLRAVAFCTWNEGLEYTLDIYKNPVTGDPTSGTLLTSQSGLFAFIGYYTIPLETPVQLSAGDTFSVVFTQSVSDDEGIYTPYDATLEDDYIIDWCRFIHADHGDTSFYREPDGEWTDCADDGDFRIKAFTDDMEFQVSAESNNNDWGTVTVDGNTIYATPATGYYVSNCEVISGTASFSINENTITVTPSSDCVIRVIFAPNVGCTVTFMASGTLEGTQSAAIYEQITLPTSVSVQADGWTFSGWTNAQFTETQTAPAVFYEPGEAYTVTGDTTLYAVFTRVEEDPVKTYELVTANVTDWSGNYVITNRYDVNVVVFKSVSGDQSLENKDLGSAPALADAKITLTGTTLKNVAPEYVFTVAKNGSMYTIKSATNCWIGIDENKKLHNYTSYVEANANWTITYESGTYYKCMKIKNTAGGSFPYLANSGLGFFEASNEFDNKKTYFWKENSNSTTYYYTNPVGGLHVHTPEYVEALAPTCVEDGHSAYYRCTECEKLFSDEACQHEITLASTVISATGNHTYGSWTSKNNGTHERSCSVCGSKQTQNCVYTSVVTSPTCTDMGYTTYTCSSCNYSYQGNQTVALGHAWGDWTVTTNPSCTNSGVETRVCSRCNVSETQNVDSLGHDYVAVETAPTCTEGGYTTHTCSRCGDAYTDTATNPLGHAWDDGVVTKEATENEDGERLFTCSRCETSRTEVIPRLNQTNPFVDVSSGKYYYNPVLWAYYHNPRITSGTDATHFSPNAPCTREQIVFFLWAASGKPAPTGTTVKFTDVKSNKYYYEAVQWAQEKGITNGISATLFGVGKYCTREQIVTFLWRCADSPEPTVTNSFEDVSSKAYYAKAVSWAVENGVTGGTSATTFSPKKLCTRAEVVTFLYAAREKLNWD